jgi:hypothetical protein
MRQQAQRALAGHKGQPLLHFPDFPHRQAVAAWQGGTADLRLNHRVGCGLQRFVLVQPVYLQQAYLFRQRFPQ